MQKASDTKSGESPDQPTRNNKSKSIMAKNDKKREMVEKTRSQREIMRAIIIEARKVLPTLAAISKKSEFELTIPTTKTALH